MPEPAAPNLLARVPEGGLRDPDAILDRFLGWVAESGLRPYPHQEQALLELMLGRHVVLSTPTGSGKSLVAQALHFKGLCEGRRSFYTSPTKALASEKFFAWCDAFGAANVGMLTGDASVNPAAPIVCCTAEVLSNMALRRGSALDAPYVVMDEFHYYDDRERGAAWQIPLLVLENTRFLLMSATLGNTAAIEAHVESVTGVPVAHVHTDERPVPLAFEYSETPLHETLERLVERDRAPIYVVSFTQRECAERAQGLTSANLADRALRRRIAEAVGDFRFDTPFGRDLQRFLRSGVAVHHAGMLPRYRLLVEKLAQRGLLQVICGTDTLGVGVNVPIRTVVFSQLCKYDGEKVALLSVREFKQIAGRAGRKGFDELGTVVCQAPEHVIEGRRRAGRGARRGPARKPARGTLSWSRETFDQLVAKPPEVLRSRFDVNHGVVVAVLQREEEAGRGEGGYRALLELVARCHESERVKRRLRRRTAALFRSLRRAGIVQTVVDAETARRRGRVKSDLQFDFSMHRDLSLFLVEALRALDPASPSHALEVLSIAEAIQENPLAILYAQEQKARRELLARLKAEGVPWEERNERLEGVSWPRPEAEFLYEAFRVFAAAHPWLEEEGVKPKSVARDMVEGYWGFVDYVREYGLARSEGLLLRYLSQVHHTLAQTVPVEEKSEELLDVIAFLRTTVQGVDSSLAEAWEGLLAPVAGAAPAAAPARPFDLAREPRALAARVRAELHALLRDLAARDFEAAAAHLRPDPEHAWDARRLEAELAPFFAEYGEIDFSPRARQAQRTRLDPDGPRRWRVQQVLCDPRGEDLWALFGDVDLAGQRDPQGPLLRLHRIGP
jgi:superfamily II RNA helicase